ncbi:M48 family metalloprotease [Glycomyces tritici]|uniref:M48 family metalloprotease n=1 Tax=Glycomyces tritici TaxID=2665176 RepID=A0ABT7YV13_9ACTN|nr:M48 family metalloprotease [Glycomyces tritici]MDN3242432.1 M48 family metalloprotease [Glycomyces tritici]
MSSNPNGEQDPRPLPAWVQRRVQAPPQPGVFQPPPKVAKPSRKPKPANGKRSPQRSRRIDASTLGLLLVAVPWVIYSASIVAAIAYPFGAFALAPLLWLLSGALVFFRPMEAAIAKWFFKYRPPTPRELDVLLPAWKEVAAAAGIHSGSYQLWIQNSDGINAAAAAGHLVAVTRRALDVLQPHQLQAVLAHELGHHSAGHAWSGLLLHWYSLPARIFNRMLVWTSQAILWAALISVRIVLGAFSGLLSALAGLGLIGLFAICAICAYGSEFLGGLADDFGAAVILLLVNALLVGPVVGAFALVSATTMAWLSRRGELRADRAAVRLGYGPALLDTLEDWLQTEPPFAPTISQRLLATHPPLAARIQRLKVALGVP